MNIIDILSIALALSLDAVAISITNSIKTSNNNIKEYLIMSFSFGIFQMIMPIIGYLISYTFYKELESISNILSFIILFYLGISMIIKKETENQININIKNLFIYSIITSIDALSIGITLSFQNNNIIISSIIIGVVTFILCLLASILGNYFKKKYRRLSYIIGGILLIIISIKIII